jgi:predicted anti-sigma-YlaC factor YlaD
MVEASEHLTCQEVVELVTDYLEGAMNSDDAALFEQHLNLCDGCVTYVEQMRITIATVGRIQTADLPPGSRERLLAAFRGYKR